MSPRIYLLAICLCWILPAHALFAQDKYFVIVFGANNGKPKVAHTWATFIKLPSPDAAATLSSTAPLESHTFSWLPTSGVVTPRLFGGGEPGRNFTLEESLQWARGHAIPVVAWGPVEIRKELFDWAVARKKVLDSGRLGYRMLDRPGRNTSVTNCIHAVSDIVPGPQLITGIAYGVEASALVANHLRPYMVRPEVNHAELVSRVGLEKHEVRYLTMGR